MIYTRNPQAAAKLGYVNPGTDRRIAGWLGKLLGGLQTNLSYKSSDTPLRTVQRLHNGFMETTWDPHRPDNRHYTIALERPGGRWATIRFGYRYDPNWGDERSIGYNPRPDIVGGYIFDIAIKLNATQTFIEGHEHG